MWSHPTHHTTPPPPPIPQQGNRFGDVFQQVSEDHGLHAAIQAFDRRIVKVPASRVVAFYEEVVSLCIEQQVLV